jgi:type IV fimbrial biogenesis protein FimT
MKPFRSSSSSAASRHRLGRPSRGFTLIELMVTIALAAILTTLAAPSMTSMIKYNRIQTETSSLIGDLQYARTEAVKRGQPVSVCPSSDGLTCLTANTWQGGWIVFPDATGSGAIVTGVLPVRKRKALASGDTAAASTAPTTNAITFNRDGFAIGLGTAAVMMQVHSADNDPKATRCVSVDIGGRMTTLVKGAASMGVTCS